MALDNFLNHPDYGIPNANITSTAAGVISSTRRRFRIEAEGYHPYPFGVLIIGNGMG